MKRFENETLRYSFWRMIRKDSVFFMPHLVFISINSLYYCSGNYYRRKIYGIDTIHSAITTCNAQVTQAMQRQLALLFIMYLSILGVER